MTDAASGPLVGRLYLVADSGEIARRRPLVPAGRLVEAWPDLHTRGEFWMGESAKALLDGAGTPLPAKLELDAAAVPVYYGPRLCDIDSLPADESRVAQLRDEVVELLTSMVRHRQAGAFRGLCAGGHRAGPG